MISDVHDLRRFVSRTINPSEIGTLSHLKSAYQTLKNELNLRDKELAVSDLSKDRADWEVFSPYENYLTNRYAVALNLVKVSIGILSYGYLEMVEVVIEFVPTPEQFDTRDAHMIGGLLGMILPIPNKFRDRDFIRKLSRRIKEMV